MKPRTPIRLTLMALGLLLASSSVLAGDPAAEVVFAIGDVKITQNGELRPLQRGDKVFAGDELLTGNNGHIHLKTVDAGFISVRPASHLLIHQYHYAAQNPKENAIRFELKSGVVRSVTGKGGEMAKDRFRLSTPVAAIGIRGTDFTVYTSMNETRVAVRSGGVAVSPFNANCVAAALGPCSGSTVADLYAGNNNALLQVRSTDHKPMLRQDKTGTLLPEAMAPGLPEEQQSLEGKPAKTSHLDKETVFGNQKELNAEKLQAAGQDKPKAYAKLEWGRWAGKVQDLSPSATLLATGIQNSLYSKQGVVELPDRGNFAFNLQAANAVVSNEMGLEIQSLQVKQASLSIDFATQRFDTKISVEGTALPNAVELKSAGWVSEQGRFSSMQYFSGSNMSVDGGLSGDAKEAAYLFQHKLQDGRLISGATSWQR